MTLLDKLYKEAVRFEPVWSGGFASSEDHEEKLLQMLKKKMREEGRSPGPPTLELPPKGPVEGTPTLELSRTSLLDRLYKEALLNEGKAVSDMSKEYPARTDSNGNTWYRPVQEPGIMWGWTSDPKQAHPDYHADGVSTDD